MSKQDRGKRRGAPSHVWEKHQKVKGICYVVSYKYIGSKRCEEHNPPKKEKKQE